MVDSTRGAEVEARRWWVVGRVQGVGFRWFVQQAARAEGLDGDVRNLEDGRVEVRVRGPRDAVGRLLDAVRRGPVGAVVERVEERALEDGVAFGGFRVRH